MEKERERESVTLFSSKDYSVPFEISYSLFSGAFCCQPNLI